MPAIFSDEQKMKLQEKLLSQGFELIKKYGYRRMTIDELTKSCFLYFVSNHFCIWWLNSLFFFR